MVKFNTYFCFKHKHLVKYRIENNAVSILGGQQNDLQCCALFVQKFNCLNIIKQKTIPTLFHVHYHMKNGF